MDMIALAKTLSVTDKAKLLTEILGDIRHLPPDERGFLTEITKVRNKIKGRPEHVRTDRFTIKAGAFDLIVAMIEGEKA